jgi:hypothetical protein
VVVPNVHVPTLQYSPSVQALLSSQAVPEVRFCAKQAPVLVLHTPTVHCESRLVQLTGVPPVHVPDALHVSPVVQRLLSSQSSPAGRRTCVHDPVLGLHWPS